MLFKILVLLFLYLSIPAAYADGVVHFKNGMWFNGTSFERGDFYSIDGVLQKKQNGTVTQVIDLQEKFVIPPLADAHNHGLSSPQRLDEEIQSFLSRGIFYVMNPNNIAKLTDSVRRRMNKAESVDAVWSNGGLTGSGGHPIQIYAQFAGHGNETGSKQTLENQAYYVVDSLNDLKKKWPLIVADRPDFIKVYLEYSEEYEQRKTDPAFYGKRGLNPKILPEIVKYAHDSKLRVAAHVNTAVDFRNAIRSGVNIIAHLPLERITQDDAKLAAENHTTVITTTLSHRPTNHIKNLSEVLQNNIQILENNGVLLALGTDSHRSIVEEAENILRLGAMDRAAVLNAATQRTAQLIFPNRKIGRLAEGYEANFIALDANPLEDFSNVRKIALLVKNGHVLRLKTPVATVLMEDLKKNGVDSAVQLYRSLRSTKVGEYDFSESQLNKLGYELLQQHNISAAIVIFETDVEFFPESSNVYDSLGEAYMARGDKENARKNYQKSLQLNPQNKNALEMLKRLESQ